MYRYYRYKTERPHYDADKKFYVCSSGGCASQMICHYLGNFGDVYHLHSRQPPIKLTNTGYDDNKTYAEWFSNLEIPDNELYKYKVIFLYRNPLEVIYSRYIDAPNMLKNVQCKDIDITVADCIAAKKDLFELEDFFDNYTNSVNQTRNYPIYCVKYAELFDNISQFNQIFSIPNIATLYPTKCEKNKDTETISLTLKEIYKPFNTKIEAMKFIEIR